MMIELKKKFEVSITYFTGFLPFQITYTLCHNQNMEKLLELLVGAE